MTEDGQYERAVSVTTPAANTTYDKPHCLPDA